MIALLGLVLLHACGAVIRQVLTRCGWRVALRSPSSAWFAVVIAYAVSLGGSGFFVLVGLAVVASQACALSPNLSPAGERGLLGLSAIVLARPWMLTEWDEFVWLGKARFESLGFGAGVQAALDPAQHVIPAGYPPLWPSIVGWLSLGHDSITTQVLAASLLVLLCAATALESIPSQRPAVLAIAVLAAAPLVWVHARSTYVDLPVGLLGVAFVSLLLSSERPPLLAGVIAVVLVGFKDDGLAQVHAGTGAALLVQRKWRLALPAIAALIAMATWRGLVLSHGVPLFDHALGMPQWSWFPTLLRLLAVHASDLFSWGVFWAVTLGVLLIPSKDPSVRGLKAMLGLLLFFTAVALLSGPERVRVFAENGTLLNRVLLQFWPSAALLVLLGLRATQPRP